MATPVPVTVYFLEMTSPSDLRPAEIGTSGLQVVRVERTVPEFNRFLYTAVGGEWYWIDRLGWNYGDWQRWLTQTGVETWVGYQNGAPVGYYELQRLEQSVNIAYFGLLSGAIGRGLGKRLLTHAVRRGWRHETRRLTLNTCSLDHPNALANYQARGFRVIRETREMRHLPPRAPGPWPGA
ncbi:MAG: GNAT family N-acetyltransferase [Candidatus Competibacterales bacterium]|nr:GNAT family N-acetyltransferase [Candidatus Competibacterales bacterium]